jgi:hypothetical protein
MRCDENEATASRSEALFEPQKAPENDTASQLNAATTPTETVHVVREFDIAYRSFTRE